MKKVKEKNPIISTTGEKIRFGMGDLGSNIIWGFIGGFITIYYTDNVLISAATVGTIMLLARIMDGISDIFMGLIIEKTNSKWGKARPWILWMCIPLCISFIMSFHFPTGMTEGMKIIYAAVTYIVLALAYTAVNVSYITLLTLFAPDSNDRNVAATYRSLFAMAGAIIVGIITVPLLTAMGGVRSQLAWDKLTISYSIVTVICLLITFFGVKEKKFTENIDNASLVKDHVPLKIVIKHLFKNKYFILSALITVPYYMALGTSTAVNVFYARDILGDANLAGIIAAVGLPTMIIAAVIAPMLYNKFGKQNVMIVGSVIVIITAVAQFINPFNKIFFLALYSARGFGTMLFGVGLDTLPGYVADYSEWKTGERAVGFVSSVLSFGIKVGTGLGSALVGWILAFGHYDGARKVQLHSALNSEIVLMIGIPMIFSVVQVVMLLFWDMDKIHPQLLAELEDRRTL